MPSLTPRRATLCLLLSLLAAATTQAFVLPSPSSTLTTLARRHGAPLYSSTKDETDKPPAKPSMPFAAAPLNLQKQQPLAAPLAGERPLPPPAAAPAVGGRRKPDPEKNSYMDFEDETAPGMAQQLDGDLLRDGGVLKTIVKAGDGALVSPGAEVAVKYEGRTEDGTVLCRGEDFRFLQGDGTMIGGFETAVGSMRVGEVAKVVVKPWYAYGSSGVSPVVGPDTALEFDIEVLESSGNFLNPRSFRDMDPKKLRDAKSIAQDYKTRSELRMRNEEDLSEFDKTLKWFKGLYFFGFFEGETGERAPWYLRPTITFPIMFLVCASAFYVLISFGGVSIKRDIVLEDSIDLAVAWFGQVFA